jgi:hypothetical protein
MTKEDVKTAVAEALKESGHKCQFNITAKQAQQLSNHLIGLTALGEGNMSVGLDEMQANHRFTQTQRRFRDRIIMRVGAVVIGVLGVGMMYALWEGVVHFVAKAD